MAFWFTKSLGTFVPRRTVRCHHHLYSSIQLQLGVLFLVNPIIHSFHFIQKSDMSTSKHLFCMCFCIILSHKCHKEGVAEAGYWCRERVRERITCNRHEFFTTVGRQQLLWRCAFLPHAFQGAPICIVCVCVRLLILPASGRPPPPF